MKSFFFKIFFLISDLKQNLDYYLEFSTYCTSTLDALPPPPGLWIQMEPNADADPDPYGQECGPEKERRHLGPRGSVAILTEFLPKNGIPNSDDVNLFTD